MNFLYSCIGKKLKKNKILSISLRFPLLFSFISVTATWNHIKGEKHESYESQGRGLFFLPVTWWIGSSSRSPILRSDIIGSDSTADVSLYWHGFRLPGVSNSTAVCLFHDLLTRGLTGWTKSSTDRQLQSDFTYLIFLSWLIDSNFCFFSSDENK